MESHFSSDRFGCYDYGPSHPQVRLAGYFPRSHFPTPPTSPSPPLRSLQHSQSLPMLKPRNITPPEDKLTQVMESSSSSEATQSQYEQTLVTVKKLEEEHPERPVLLTLSCRDFSRLMKDLSYDESDQKYNISLQSYFVGLLIVYRWPKYSYNASTSCLVVQCMPSPVHETIITTFAEAFYAARLSLPHDYQNKLDPVTGENFSDFQGSYDGSDQIPDFAIQIQDDAGNFSYKFVLEVGFSELHDSLLQSAKLWIEGTSTVSIVVLVDLEEAPKYQCPVSKLSDEEFNALQLPSRVPPSMFELPLHHYGPAVYRGLHWTGEISRAQVEVWKKDVLTGEAYTDGQRMVCISFTLLISNANNICRIFSR